MQKEFLLKAKDITQVKNLHTPFARDLKAENEQVEENFESRNQLYRKTFKCLMVDPAEDEGASAEVI